MIGSCARSQKTRREGCSGHCWSSLRTLTMHIDMKEKLLKLDEEARRRDWRSTWKYKEFEAQPHKRSYIHHPAGHHRGSSRLCLPGQHCVHRRRNWSGHPHSDRKSCRSLQYPLTHLAIKKLSLNSKLRIYNSNVKSALLYGCKIWRVLKSSMAKIQVFVNRCLRQILGVWWYDKLRNEELWRSTSQEPIEQQIKRRKWRWLGHTLRKPADNVTRRGLRWTPQGKRKRGRLKTT